jgi:hypothetical protein
LKHERRDGEQFDETSNELRSTKVELKAQLEGLQQLPECEPRFVEFLAQQQLDELLQELPESEIEKKAEQLAELAPQHVQSLAQHAQQTLKTNKGVESQGE